MAKVKPEVALSSAEAADLINRELGTDLNEKRLNALIRSWAPSEVPEVVRGRRRWNSEDLERLRSRVRERLQRA